MKNISKKDIKRIEFFSNYKDQEIKFSEDFYSYFEEVLNFFKKEMHNPTIDIEDLFKLWSVIYKFRKFDLRKQSNNQVFSITDILSETVNTKGFSDIFSFLIHQTLNVHQAYSVDLQIVFDYFHYLDDSNNSINLYVKYFKYLTNYADNIISLESFLTKSNNEDFILKHSDEICFLYSKEEKESLFKNNVLNIINKNTIYKKDAFNLDDRENKCMSSILKFTPDDFVFLDTTEFSRFITLCQTYGLSNLSCLADLIRVINFEELKLKFSIKNAFNKYKKTFKNSKERASIVERILNIKIDCSINEKDISIFNFDFESQLFLAEFKNIKELLTIIVKNKLFSCKDNLLILDDEHKKILKINFNI